MKYKIGDKVKIKTWKVMEKEYGLDENRNIQSQNYKFTIDMEREINAKFPDRILTIEEIKEEIKSDFYRMKEINYGWVDEMIEGLATPPTISLFPTTKRFQLMDLE